jgi:phosphatidylglycerophosphate synthase
MPLPKTVIIRIASSKKNISLIFQENIAGVTAFKRLIFSLQRAGIENFIIFQQNSTLSQQHSIETTIKSDSRFKSNLQWHSLHNDSFSDNLNSIKLLPKLKKVLLVEGDLVTTSELIKGFINSSNALEPIAITGLFNENRNSDGIYLLLPSDVENYLRFGSLKKEVTPVHLSGPWFFRKRIKYSESTQSIEKGILDEHKLHYHQFMDIWVNSIFSIKISSLLVKTFLTPNQITILGLFIGLASGILFAQGNYWNTLIGGVLLSITAILDCCDGDVARLKFMESDFGENLDTACDNIINIFIFIGIMLGVARYDGLIQALIPFALLMFGGGWIFYLIYFPKGGKGSYFTNTPMYNIIQILASRNFIYVILLFCIFNKLNWFLWIAGIGSIVFGFFIYRVKNKISAIEIN